MKHAASRALHAYWDRLRGTRAAPERADLDPGAIRSLLGDVYLLELGMPRQFTIRLAGTRLCTLFCRELKGSSLDSLFAHGDRGEIADLVTEVTGNVIPMVVGIGGETAAGQTIDLELMALPLRHRGRTQTRLVGSLAALDVPYWVGTVPVERLRIVSARRLYPGIVPLLQEGLDHEERPRPTGRLKVLPGGRA
jgi:hypothetical protein